jgi:ferredoxin
MKVSVDASLCQGHNRCFALAPDLFQLDDAGFASAVGDGTVPPGREEAAELAGDNCPETAVLFDE